VGCTECPGGILDPVTSISWTSLSPAGDPCSTMCLSPAATIVMTVTPTTPWRAAKCVFDLNESTAPSRRVVLVSILPKRQCLNYANASSKPLTRPSKIAQTTAPQYGGTISAMLCTSLPHTRWGRERERKNEDWFAAGTVEMEPAIAAKRPPLFEHSSRRRC